MNPEHWIARLAKLKRDKDRNRWSASVKHHAPHKPLLLLCMLNLFESCVSPGGVFALTPEVIRLFRKAWGSLELPGKSPNVALPYVHCQTDGIWELKASGGQFNTVPVSRTIGCLRKHSIEACFDPDLFIHLQDPAFRMILTTTLFREYFDEPSVQQLRSLMLLLPINNA
jgi:predicted restriction endonuclease